MIQLLESSLIEKDVENAWRKKISEFFPNATITSPFNTDGYLEDNDGKISVLFEFKFQDNLKSKLSQVNILSQTLFYLKRFEKSGQKLPKVILIADKNEAFVIHSNPLVKYLDFPLNWGAAASSAFKVNPELISEMLNDSDINPFVFDIKEGFNFNAVKNKIVDLSENVNRLVKVTEHNINNVFEYFQKNVLGKNALSVNETANLFVNLIINPGENYLHPKRKNILITKSFGDVYVNTDKFLSFFSHFDGEQYSIREKEALTAIVDRIVEDETRRRKGEFFTPTIWVDEAHKMISEAFGENWKEEYVVWDPASGTLNLTRDYKFKELYCSTIEESDLKTAEQMKYNPEAVKFQYDFLNDGIVDSKIDIENDPKLPEGLKRALLEGKKIIVLMNPPYGKSNGSRGGISENKKISKGIGETNIWKKMSGLNKSASQLYIQFLYRFIDMNKNINLCFFSPTIFMSGGSYDEFRKLYYSNFNFKNGYLISSSNFADVEEWGLSFTIWENSKTNKLNEINLKVLKLGGELNDTIDYFSDKKIYSVNDEKKLSTWLRLGNEKKSIEYPKLSNPLCVINNSQSSRMIYGGIGCILFGGNNIYQNPQMVSIFTANSSQPQNSPPITKSNFIKVCNSFVSRKTVMPNWTNDKDEYMAPNESHPLWQQFQLDSLVYSLFHIHSFQSSLRQIDYKGKKWDIKNEFFWMSKSEMMDLAEKKFFDDVYRDARSSDERYVYTLLFKEEIYEKLSPDAKDVLDTATSLVKKSFEMRNILHQEHPEYHLNTWDAGWYQIKLVLKAFYPDDLSNFVKKYKEFEDRMRPLVYELGFLRK